MQNIRDRIAKIRQKSPRKKIIASSTTLDVPVTYSIYPNPEETFLCNTRPNTATVSRWNPTKLLPIHSPSFSPVYTQVYRTVIKEFHLMHDEDMTHRQIDIQRRVSIQKTCCYSNHGWLEEE